MESLVEESLVARLRAAGCVFAEEEARLLVADARSPGHLDEMVRLRVGGLPLEHILGWAEFDGLRVRLAAGVFVPRRRSELVVHEAARLAPPRAVVVELCCGAAAIATALARRVHPAEIHAIDIDAGAVECARRNLPAGSHVSLGDLYDALPDRLLGRVDLVLVNPPYAPTGEVRLMPAEARLHEPRAALDGGPDGLSVLRRVVAHADRWLAANGHLLLEASDRQAESVVGLCAEAGLTAWAVADEEIGGTAIVARRSDG